MYFSFSFRHLPQNVFSFILTLLLVLSIKSPSFNALFLLLIHFIRLKQQTISLRNQNSHMNIFYLIVVLLLSSDSERSSSIVTLAQRSNSYCLELTNESFYCTAPIMREKLPNELRVRVQNKRYICTLCFAAS